MKLLMTKADARYWVLHPHHIQEAVRDLVLAVARRTLRQGKRRRSSTGKADK